MGLPRYFILAPVVWWAAAVPAAAQSVTVQFGDGRVSVVAENAPVSQILAEWSRLGGTTFVNGEQVPGGPVTLQLENVSEQEALEVLLREASGYMVAARQVPDTGASAYDRVMILPTSNPPRAAPPSFTPPPPPVAFPFPEFEQPEVLFDPNAPEGNPPVDALPPGDPDAPVRRPRVWAPFAPPVQGQPVPPQPFEPDDPADPFGNGQQQPPPNNPFGVRPGSDRPGVITPVPRQDPDVPPPQPEPEP